MSVGGFAVYPESAIRVNRHSTWEAVLPRRTDIQTIMVIGSGPIVIGQACEFVYSGTQACGPRALGYRVVLLNSNPATIMTDPGVADATYVEPLSLGLHGR